MLSAMDRDPETYEVRTGERSFERLSAKQALEIARELIAHGEEPFIYDRFGDPMGLVELEMVARE